MLQEILGWFNPLWSRTAWRHQYGSSKYSKLITQNCQIPYSVTAMLICNIFNGHSLCNSSDELAQIYRAEKGTSKG